MKLLSTIVFTFCVCCSYAQKEIKDTTKLITDTSIARSASFPGGDVAWQKFVQKILERHMDAFIADGKSGVCRLKFVVNEDGSITDIKAVTMQDSELAKQSINAILKGPKWIPARFHGKYLKAYREVPITFTIANQ